MKRLIANGLVYDNLRRSFFSADVLIEDKKISKILGRGELCDVDAELVDARGCYLTPGFIDVHTHGIAGYDFLNADETALRTMAKAYLSHGVTCVMPTLASATLDELAAAIRRISDFSASSRYSYGGAELCGVHLEGRYLSPCRRGAHAESLLAKPSASELEALFSGVPLRAIHISAALELDENREFLNKALELGATLGLAHTSATYAEALECERLGACAYTHLYNAMPPLNHREGGAVLSCLLGDAYAELICDGVHIAPEVVCLTQRIKKDKLVLISDSMEATGLSDGSYSIAGNPVCVSGGVARTLDGSLAGSTLTLDVALKNLINFASVSLEDALISVTEAPAKEIGVFDEYGSLEVGKRADILLLDCESLALRKAFTANGACGLDG